MHFLQDANLHSLLCIMSILIFLSSHLQFSGIYILSFVVIIVGVLLYSIHGTKEAAPDSRYNLFRDEHETVPNVESDANTLNGEGELTEEERDQMHKEFNRHLNGTN